MTTLRKVGILGTGHYVPERVLSNHDLEKMVETSDEWIYSRTGMRERRIAAEDQATSDLCIEAGRRALEDAGVEPEDIDLVIVATITSDHCVPSTSAIVQHGLGCKNAGAYDLNAACSGFVMSLVTARAMITSGMMNKVLIIGGEAMSRIINYEDRTSCILFGDGAGAAVVSADAERGEILHGSMKADGSGAHFMRVYAGGSRRPADQEAVAERMNKLLMQGNETFKFAVSIFRSLVETQLKTFDLRPEEIGIVIPHQVNYRIIESALKKLDIPEDRIFMNLEKYGNTSGASVGIAFDEARRAGLLEPGQYVSMIAFGAGLTWASTLMRW